MKKIFVIICTISTICTYAQTMERKTLFSKGQVLEKVDDIKFTNNVNMMGQDVTTNASTKLTTEYKVNSVTDKNSLFEISIKKIVTDMSAMGQQMSYNSDKPEDSSSVIGAIMKNAIGKKTDVTLDKNGFITYVDTATAQSFLQTMMATTSILGNGLAVGKTFELIADLPAKPVQKGDTWTDSTQSGDSSKQVITYNIQNIANNKAVVLLNGTLVQKRNIEQNGMSISTDITGKLNGQMEVDISTNIITNKLLNVDMTGTMQLMGNSAPTTATMTITETTTQ